SFAFLLFWLFQAFWKPYRFKSLNLINDLNIKFCLFLSVVGLFSVFIHFQEVLFGSVVLIWTTIMYSLNIHYILIHFKEIKRLLSRFNQTLQIDETLFSEDYDFRKQVVRRVWHEGLCTLLLGMPEYRIAEEKALQWREELPGTPYLVNFGQSHGERLVENFMLLEGLGTKKYRQASQRALVKDGSDEKELTTQRIVRSDFTGPDCFWKPQNAASLKSVTTFFGRADVIPFPFMVIFKYDQHPTPVCISGISDLRAFVSQNQHPQVRMRRKVRLMLRALEDREVFAPITIPWETLQATHSRRPQWFQRARSSVSFRSGVLKIHRNCQNKWQGFNLNSGFRVSIQYKDGQASKSNGAAISGIPYTRLHRSLGLRDDFKVTPTLGKLFQDNHSIISMTMKKMELALGSHRSYFSRQAAWKQNKMSFAFLEVFFDDVDSIPRNQLTSRLKSHLLLNEVDQQLRLLPQICRGSLAAMEERMERINDSQLNQWWFVVFDDIYRRNYQLLNRLSNKPEDFSPYHRGSVCYKPMVRSDLERFLIERGVYQATEKARSGEGEPEDFQSAHQQPSNHPLFHSGFLNRIYFHLDLFIFRKVDRSPNKLGSSHTDNCFPRSKLYQGVYGKGMPSHHFDGSLWMRLKRGLRKRLLLEEPYGGMEEDTDVDSEDLENSEQRTCQDQEREQLIKLGPWHNLSKLDLRPKETLEIDHDKIHIVYHHPQDTFSDQRLASSRDNSNGDRSTYVHSSDYLSTCNTSNPDSFTGHDITEEPVFHSED
ncbi:hypothetical protein PCANC_28598, partial [Puccinia coronata f. sp. avenae]